MGNSYDSLRIQLTLQNANIMQQVKEDGIYIPHNISRTSCEPQFFAMDNSDWNNKTQQGGSFHATTAIIIQNPQSDPHQNIPKITRIPSSRGISRDRTLHNVTEVKKICLSRYCK